jgi:hypothetical protein
MANENIKWKHIAYVAGGLAIVIAFIVLVIAQPERKAIDAENQRLERAEERVIEAITAGSNDLAKAMIIQLRWQYEASTSGGISECNKLRQTWRNKRIEYLKLIGENPDDFMVDDNEGKTKSLKEQWKEVVGE